MISKTNPIRMYGRNAMVSIKRIQRAIGHHDKDEILYAVLKLLQGLGWSLCVILLAVCLVLGFFPHRHHCLVTAVFYLALSWLVWHPKEFSAED